MTIAPASRDNNDTSLAIGTAGLEALRWAMRRGATGRRVALAVLLDAVDGGPRSAGALAAFDDTGYAFGTLSAGCVDADVAQAAYDAIRTGIPRDLHFASDEDGLESGLTCGAAIDVRVFALDARAIDDVRAFVGSIDVGAERAMLRLDDALANLRHERRKRLRVYGATVFAPPLAAIATIAGLSVTLIDPRPHLLDPLRERIACIDAWPHEHHDADLPSASDAIVVTAHDPKFELPLLERALRSEAGYVGALGSRRTAERRREELLRRGLAPEAIARLRSPIGLDLGGREPEETALAIVAEIVALAHRATGAFLATGDRPIHADANAYVD